MQELLLNEQQKDALQEVANIGAGHASTVLSQMINRSIKMGIPKIEIIPLEKTRDYVKDEKVVVGIFLKISEEIPCYVLLLIPRESAFSLANLLLGCPSEETSSLLSEMDKSALHEVSNVMICAFFDSLSELTGLSIVPGPPHLAYDIPDAVMDYVLIQIGAMANQIVMFNVELSEEQKTGLKIHMFLLPLPNSVDILLEKLGIK
jgi:chemotaxis protein CheC